MRRCRRRAVISALIERNTPGNPRFGGLPKVGRQQHVSVYRNLWKHRARYRSDRYRHHDPRSWAKDWSDYEAEWDPY